MSTPPVPAVGAPVVALGGAAGALLRWGIGELWPVATDGFPWPTLVINVVGSGLLAALPLLAVVRRHPLAPLLLGTGVLGGFTTMSAASAQAVQLADHGHAVTAAAYVLLTLGGALLAVALVHRLAAPPDAALVEDEEGDL